MRPSPRQAEQQPQSSEVQSPASLGKATAQTAQIVQLGPADPALGDHLDPVDRRAVHREGALHAYAIADLAHGKCLSHAATLAADDHALEDLDPRAVALLHPDVHLQRVTGTKVRDVLADLSLLKVGYRGVHDVIPC